MRGVERPYGGHMSSTIRNVIFDLGGVVLHWDAPGVINSLVDDAETRNAMNTIVLHNDDWKAMDRGTMTVEDMIARTLERYPFDPILLKTYFTAAIDSLQPIPDAVELIEDLRRAGISTFVLSNMPRDFADNLTARYDFWNQVDGIVFSCNVNLVKPEAAVK
jgi:putative hydrolase of the HAD superfamily